MQLRRAEGENIGLAFGKLPFVEKRGRILVAVHSISPMSPGDKAGFKNGDLICAVNGIQIINEKQCTKLFSRLFGDISVLIERSIEKIEDQDLLPSLISKENQGLVRGLNLAESDASDGFIHVDVPRVQNENSDANLANFNFVSNGIEQELGIENCLAGKTPENLANLRRSKSEPDLSEMMKKSKHLAVFSSSKKRHTSSHSLTDPRDRRDRRDRSYRNFHINLRDGMDRVNTEEISFAEEAQEANEFSFADNGKRRTSNSSPTRDPVAKHFVTEKSTKIVNFVDTVSFYFPLIQYF